MRELPMIERAISHGDRIALRSATGNHTYRKLLADSENVAAALLLDCEDLNEARIAFLVPPGEDYIGVQWGIWRCGGIAVPLSLSATERELEYALTDARTDTLVATRELAGRVGSLCDRHGIRLLCTDNLPTVAEAALPEIATDRRAMILYTSGTTSQPKGVVTTHACIQAQIEPLIEAWLWKQDDRIPLFLPLHHIHGIINVLSCALWAGAMIEVFPRFELEPILKRVAEKAYTVFMAVPTIYVKLIEGLEALSTSHRDSVVSGFADMRLMISGSAALPSSLHEAWTQLTGQKLLERYGMTEIGMALSNPYAGERRPGAVGQPLPGVQVRLQAESGETVTNEGVAGEIQVRGPNVFHEYWNRPAATRESFVDGWFRTGDVAVLEDGYYRIMGRSSVDIIKSGGYKLSALEIETALLDHPSIAECAVVGIPDDKWGEIIAVAIVLRASEELDINALRLWCQDRLSSYKLPRKMVVVDDLPRNAMGKVTKPKLKGLFEGPPGDE